MASFRNATIDAIFGGKKYLRPGEDDDKLLQLLEADTSDLDQADEDSDEDENIALNEEFAPEDEDGEIDDGEDDPVIIQLESEMDPNRTEESDKELEVNEHGDEVRNSLGEIDEVNRCSLDQQTDDDEDDNVPLRLIKENLKKNQKSKNAPPKKKSKKTVKPTYTWKKCDQFSGTSFETSVVDYKRDKRINFNVFDYFSMYFEQGDFNTITECTNVKYMLLRNKPLNLTVDETKRFFGIVFLMSILKYPRIKMYWAKITKVYPIVSTMTRDRFFTIRSHLKVVIDGEVSATDRQKDKLWRVRPIMDKVKQTCLALPRENTVAIDEQMIPFTGVCAVKQFVRGKPNPEGLKNFVCAAPSGLVLDFEVYQGKNTFLSGTANELGVGPSAVIRLVQSLNEGSHVYMDRYFTTIPLLEYLLERKLYATGTIMKSRVPASVHLTKEKILQRLGRGATEQSVRSDNKINIIQWYDLKPVLLASTSLQEQPTDACKRWSKIERKFIQVRRPNMVAKYNNSMGGIDLVDRMIAYYRIIARTNKWTVKTIFNFFDLAIANSWILYRSDRQHFGDKGKDIMQLINFKLKIAEWLLESKDEGDISDKENYEPTTVHTRKTPKGFSNLSSSSNWSSPTLPNNNNASIRKRQHLPLLKSELKNSARCSNPTCKKKTKFLCEKCNQFFCLTGEHNCFYTCHKK